jgi:DNA-binding transcriptional LysR family regulator
VLRSIRFGLYASPAFAKHRHASAADLSKLPFVLPQEGSEPARGVQQALADVGVACSNVAVRAQFSEVILDLAAAGRGVAAAFETMVGDRLRRGDLIELDLALPLRHRALFRRDQPPSKSLVAVEGFLRAILAN